MAFTKIPAATNRVVDFASSGTWVVPSGVYSAEFLVVGAGGGGGGCDNSAAGRSSVGGGGGGGAVKYVTLSTTPGASYTITVGAKGIGGIQTAGGNGGYTEVVLSAVTLIRSYGGGGGDGITAADVKVLAPVSKTMAGNGGQGFTSAAANLTGTGGGGANQLNAVSDLTGFTNNQGLEGQNARIGSAASSLNDGWSFGGIGINGYGAGGGGGFISDGASATATAGAAPYGAGDGVYRRATGAATASSATIAGCGGGGGAAMTTTTQSNGGAGFDGLVRISYVG
jgi:MSHA biogenesis protein MshQ